MKVEKIMESIMEKNNHMTKAQLGRAVGIAEEKNPSDVINKRMKQKNISVNVLSEMLAAMGYTLAVVPVGTKLDEKDGKYEVTNNE